eukprot:TRINITY_DN6959_c0_g1_i1.p1 TRINITY_DN6959_c0_g1~~TRINITY_DN6959_c0_g1_i1.p1  ORF type:complete len:122 (-),score=8.83 TRINITY_DN6959_c0_g1_i1:144-488(-)
MALDDAISERYFPKFQDHWMKNDHILDICVDADLPTKVMRLVVVTCSNRNVQAEVLRALWSLRTCPEALGQLCSHRDVGLITELVGPSFRDMLNDYRKGHLGERSSRKNGGRNS